jgi:hypothetical protein
MSTGFIKKLDPPHSFPFVTNTKGVLGKPIPFSQLPAPSDLSENLLNGMQFKSPFNSRTIPDLILWLDANDSSTFNDDNYIWKDKSNISYISTYIITYTQSQVAFRKFVVDGLTYVDGTAAWTIQVPNFRMRPIFTIFLVARTEMGLFDIKHSKPNSYNQNVYIRTWGYDLFRSSGLVLQDSVAFVYPESIVPLNEFFILSIGYNMSNTAIPYRVNGTNRNVTTNNGNVVNEYIISMLTLMGWTGNNSYPALVGEFIVYDRSISQEEYEQVEGYLAEKWNLKDKLPVNHPYKNKGPNSI